MHLQSITHTQSSFITKKQLKKELKQYESKKDALDISTAAADEFLIIHTKIDRVETKIDEVKFDLKEIKTDLEVKIKGVKAELKAEIAELRTEVQDLRVDMQEMKQELRKEFSAGFSAIMKKLESMSQN